jgi:hypothetical protein
MFSVPKLTLSLDDASEKLQLTRPAAATLASPGTGTAAGSVPWEELRGHDVSCPIISLTIEVEIEVDHRRAGRLTGHRRVWTVAPLSGRLLRCLG